MCILVFQLHDRQDEAAALLIEPGRGRGSVFDALQEIFRQDVCFIGPLFQYLYRKASPKHAGRQPPVGSMEKQFFTGRQR